MGDIFCTIVNGERGDHIIMEGEHWIAINDIHPQAPVHVLILPKKHIESLMNLKDDDRFVLGELLLAVSKVAKKLDLGYKGFRVIINHGDDGGQVIPHLHLHLLGGKQLGPKIVN